LKQGRQEIVRFKFGGHRHEFRRESISIELGGFAADAAVNERADFIRKTYMHLAGAVARSSAWKPSCCNAVLEGSRQSDDGGPL